MRRYEYATFWVWDTNSPTRESFDRLRDLQDQGWQVVGDFYKIEDFHNAGLWVLRRPAPAAQRKCA